MTWVPVEGQKVRFFSKLDSSVVLGAAAGVGIFVHRIDNGLAPEKTLFEVQYIKDDGAFQLFLRNVPGISDMKLTWYWPQQEPGACYLSLNPDFVDSGDWDHFRIDALDGPYFALNNNDKNRVVDILQSNTGEGARIEAYPWNGGDNQWWRAMPA